MTGTPPTLEQLQAQQSRRAGGQHLATLPQRTIEDTIAAHALGTTLPPLPPEPKPKRETNYILESDLPKSLPAMVDGSEFKAACGKAGRDRVKGEPKPGTFSAIMEAIQFKVDTSPGRIIRMGMKDIGKFAKYGKESVRKVIRKAERVGVIAMQAVMKWENGKLRRAENWYLLIPDRPPGSPESSPPDPAKRRRRPERNPRGWRDLVLGVIGLHKRPGGWNTTPLRTRAAET
jgi:hypothetical protein